MLDIIRESNRLSDVLRIKCANRYDCQMILTTWSGTKFRVGYNLYPSPILVHRWEKACSNILHTSTNPQFLVLNDITTPATSTCGGGDVIMG